MTTPLRERARALPAAFLVAALLVVPAAPRAHAGAFSTIWYWPSSCGAAVTLQQCIDLAQPDDTVAIDTNDSINGDLSIGKSISLEAEAGFDPTISGDISITASSGTLGVRIADLGISGRINVHLPGGDGHLLTFEQLTISTQVGSGIGAYLGVPTTLVARANRIESDTGSGIYVNTGNPTGVAALQLLGNRIDLGSAGESGIQLNALANGTTSARIHNNSVWNAGRCQCAGGSGFFFSAGNSPTVDLDLVGNTFSRSGYAGIEVRDTGATGGHLSLDLFDTIVAHTDGPGVAISDNQNGGTRTLRAGHNDYFDLGFANQWDGESPGTGNLKVNPRFVAESFGALTLKATSPLIDAGQICSPGGVTNLDARGRGRLAGASVDIGAYERGAPKPTGKAYVGTSGPDAILASAGNDIVCAMGGDDIVAGFEGDDYLDGGAGDDQLVGHEGADRLVGGRGDDPCLHSKDGVMGNDSIDGGTGTDGVRRDPGDVKTRTEVAAVCS